MSISDWYAGLMEDRDETYENDLLSPKAAGYIAADLFLPTDLVDTINKAGRGEEVTGTDIVIAGIDAVSTVLGAVTGGIGKIAGTGVKALLKGGTAVTSVAPFFIPDDSPTTPEDTLPDGGTPDNDGTTDTDDTVTQTPTTPNIIYVTAPNEDKNPTNSDSDGLAELLLMSLVLGGQQNTKETLTPTHIVPNDSTKDNSGFIITIAALAVLALIVVVATRN